MIPVQENQKKKKIRFYGIAWWMQHIVVLNGGGFCVQVCARARALALCLCLKLASESCNQTKGCGEEANTPNIFCPQDFTGGGLGQTPAETQPGGDGLGL